MCAHELQNNIEELFQLLTFLQPEKFDGGLEDVREEYGHLSEANQVWVRSTALDLLNARFQW